MKIGVSAVEPDLDAAVDLRFGRAPYFVVVVEGTYTPTEGPNVEGHWV